MKRLLIRGFRNIANPKIYKIGTVMCMKVMRTAIRML